MKNYQIEGKDGKMYWVHRNIAVATFIFKVIKDKWFILANKRGIGTPDNQGKWNCPCGYLDYDETLVEAAVREVKEECNLILNPKKLTRFEINDTPDSHMQNVTHRYFCVLSDKDDSEISIGTEGEENEVAEVKWIPIDEINQYEWAYGHDKIIKRLLE